MSLRTSPPQGRLSGEERAEYETYVSAIDFLGILQAKDRGAHERASARHEFTGESGAKSHASPWIASCLRASAAPSWRELALKAKYTLPVLLKHRVATQDLGSIESRQGGLCHLQVAPSLGWLPGLGCEDGDVHLEAGEVALP